MALILGYFTVESPSAMAAEGFLSNKTAAEKEHIISKMDGPAMLRLAEKHGIRVIQGKDITTPSKSTSEPGTFADQPVGTDAIEKNEPNIAPQDQ